MHWKFCIISDGKYRISLLDLSYSNTPSSCYVLLLTKDYLSTNLDIPGIPSYKQFTILLHGSTLKAMATSVNKHPLFHICGAP